MTHSKLLASMLFAEKDYVMGIYCKGKFYIHWNFEASTTQPLTGTLPDGKTWTSEPLGELHSSVSLLHEYADKEFRMAAIRKKDLLADGTLVKVDLYFDAILDTAGLSDNDKHFAEIPKEVLTLLDEGKDPCVEECGSSINTVLIPFDFTNVVLIGYE